MKRKYCVRWKFNRWYGSGSGKCVYLAKNKDEAAMIHLGHFPNPTILSVTPCRRRKKSVGT